MKLVGFAKVINGKKKFLGKVGIPLDKRFIVPVYYRETLSRYAILQVADCVSYDADAIDMAIKSGAEKLLTYCKDTNELMVNEVTPIIEGKVTASDHGEERQYRFPVHATRVMSGTVNMGWTDTEVML